MNNFRKKAAFEKRKEANHLANSRPVVPHISNGDEQKFRLLYPSTSTSAAAKPTDKPIYAVSFTKGLPHDKNTGLIENPDHFQDFVKSIDSGEPRDFQDTPLGPDGLLGSECKGAPPVSWQSLIAQKCKLGANGSDPDNPVGLRAWESSGAGLIFELEGFDSQAVTMPPHPALGSPELTAEMAEVYAQALLRDVPFHAMSVGVTNPANLGPLQTTNADVTRVQMYTNELQNLDWFSGTPLDLNPQEAARRKNRVNPNPGSAFRGITTGDNVGPYLSQFLLIGNEGINGKNDPPERGVEKGQINYGAISIDQRVRVARPGQNYMTRWEEWLDVQNAANVSGLENYIQVGSGSPERRFIYTPRDLATYVHFDALYEAYLNACLIMLSRGVPFDPGIPYQRKDECDHQQGFAHFGGPQILTLVTEVATRALKAVRYQKFNVHRRCRPEVLAARLTKADDLVDVTEEFMRMRDDIGTSPGNILFNIDNQNGHLFESNPALPDANYLLPMAFTEGSPMHPAYGAGHATVAGACVTILKAFFDCKTKFRPDGYDASQAFVSVAGGTGLGLVPVFDQNGNPAELTVEGELNKLASNISIGRDWAGVHYFTDYYESILMGEKIAIGILEEQKLLYNETFSMTLPLFGGGTIRI